MTTRERYAFSECRLDVGERRLLRAGRVVPVAPKAFDVLVAMVRRAGQLTTKAELLDAVWPQTFVEEGILAVHVSALRKALGDASARTGLIETISGSGYRFRGAVIALRDDVIDAADRQLRPPEAYAHVGLGRLHLLTADQRRLRDAESAFAAALDVDVEYAEAHAGLARTYCAQAELRMAPAQQAYARARTAAERALAIDARCADAHVAIGAVQFLADWNWDAARQSLTTALAIDPDDTDAYLLLGRLLDSCGQLDDALATKFKALEHDPLSPLVHLQIAMSYWHQRRWDDAEHWARKALAIDEQHLLAREFLAAAYWARGEFERHMEESLRHARHHGAPDEALAPLGAAFAAGGRDAVVAWMIRTLEAAGDRAPAFQLALLHGEAKQYDAAFAYLDRAIAAREPCLVHLAVAPQWDPLRGDRRFQIALDRIGLRDVGATG